MPGLKIAVDARPLCHPATGIYRYARELLLRMCPMGSQWYFYSPQPYVQSDFGASNIVHHMARVPGYLGGSQASQLLFPAWARRDEIDVFWSPRHHLPLFLHSTPRCVLSIHDLVWLRHADLMPTSRRAGEALLMPRSLKRADNVVTASHFVARELCTSFPDVESRLAVVPNGSCFEGEFTAQEARTTQSDYFLFVGTMEPRKNLALLLRAYQAYLQCCSAPKSLKLVGGPGWGDVDPHHLVSNYGLGEWVDIRGAVPDSELSELYAGAHALVMPSIYEGFGLPVVESLAFGVPAIVSRDSAMSEVAGAAGYAVDPASWESICDSLLLMTTDEQTYSRLRGNARLRSEAYNWDRSAAVMYGLLRGES